ncbi:MAG: carboxypeptidase Q [Phenylobacterium sp.]|jgi:carboxypeptidase Q
MKILSALLSTTLLLAITSHATTVDLSVVNQIKNQAFKHSQIMNYLHHLADENGPRLAGSPAYKRSADWAVETLQQAGIKDARLEPFGEFGRSWSWSSISVQMVKPQQTTLHGLPLAWSRGTKGTVEGSVVYAPLWPNIDSPNEYDLTQLVQRIEAYKKQYAGQLKGKFVLLTGERPIDVTAQPEITRWPSSELESMLSARPPELTDYNQWPLLTLPSDTYARWEMYEKIPAAIQDDYWHRKMVITDRLIAFFNQEQVGAIIKTSSEGNGGVIFAENFGSWLSHAPKAPPAVQLMPEHYNRLRRLVERDTQVTLAINVEASYLKDQVQGVNVIADLPGHSKPQEIVMMGAHLDSWHTGTGATDNGAGVAVVMEALRILKALDLKLDRTVRIGLWDAEEQNLGGSRGYVRNHLGSPITMKLKPDHEKFSVYYNIDTGSGKTRGLFAQGNDRVLPIFESLLQPFASHGISTIVPRKDWGTDHVAFDAVGLPSFNLLQDQLDYWSHTHHSNIDTIDHIMAEDLMVSAALLASLVYHSATMDTLMPRAVLPPPLSKAKQVPQMLRLPMLE